jgi:hypothetical protein
MSNEDKAVRHGGNRKYRIELPNLIDDLSLSPFAFRLYAHIKRVAGDNGACWKGTRALAKSCRISTASVVRAKKELVDAQLIAIEKVTRQGGETDQITIINVWQRNFEHYRKCFSQKQKSVSHRNQSVADRNKSVSVVAHKKEHSEERTDEENSAFSKIVESKFTLLPDALRELNDELRDGAKDTIRKQTAERYQINIAREHTKFVNHADQNGRICKGAHGWRAAWRNWIIIAIERAEKASVRDAPINDEHDDIDYDELEREIEEQRRARQQEWKGNHKFSP